MNVENLKVGMIVKNYKEMCKLLEVEEKGGKSRKLQVSDWERFFKSHKQGQKFIIDEIYSIPKEKISNRGKSSIYGDLVQLLLLDVIANKGGIITVGKTQLIKSIGMTNQNYSKSSVNIKKLAQYLNVKEECVEDFYNVSSNNFTSILDTALKNLESKKIIFQSKIKKVKEKDSPYTRDATDRETLKLLELEKMALLILGLENIQEARRPQNWNKYKSKLSELLNEHTNFAYHYDAYKLIVNDIFIEDEQIKLVDMILSKVARSNNKYKLNGMLMDNAILNAEKRHEGADNSISKYKELRKEDSYVDEFKKIVYALLDLDHKKINYEKISLEQVTKVKTVEGFILEDSDLPFDFI